MAEPRIVVIGAGPAGLAVALGLARRGRRVTLLERDAAQPTDDPASAYERWSRPSVPHSPLPHALLSRSRRALRLNAPDVLARLLAVGAWDNDLRPRFLSGVATPEDDDLVLVAVRRPVFESALRAAVIAEPLVDLRPAMPAIGIELERSDRPRVTGVRVAGDIIPADVVIDASGRRTLTYRWLAEADVRMPATEKQDCGLIYFSQFWKVREGREYPAWHGIVGPAATVDGVRYAVFLSDNGTFATVIGALSDDRELKALAREDAYQRVLALFPAVVPFVSRDVSRPTTPVLPFGALQNVFREPLLDGRPPVIGLHFVGDAYCHTNPAFAWGLCLGVDYGFALAAIVDEHAQDAEAQALAYAARTRDEARASFDAVAEEDRDRTARWHGSPLSGDWQGQTFAGFVRRTLLPLMPSDPTIARGTLRRAMLLDRPDALMRDTTLVARVGQVQERLAGRAAPAMPSRDDVVDAIGAAAPA